MRDSYRHLEITERQWGAFIDDLQRTLDKFDVPIHEQAELNGDHRVDPRGHRGPPLQEGPGREPSPWQALHARWQAKDRRAQTARPHTLSFLYRPWRGEEELELPEPELRPLLDVLGRTYPTKSNGVGASIGLVDDPRRARVLAEEGIDLDVGLYQSQVSGDYSVPSTARTDCPLGSGDVD